MDYPLENLGPERFQQICQALLIREHPDVQCFPVGQPDGGRDAVSYYFSERTGKFAVYQIKFVRKPLAEADPHKWLLEIAEAEAPKLRALVPRGASKYYLITNVPGTAHAEVGTIDRLNKLLSATLDLPSICWWRDDINRRLDAAWSIKWAYPEVLTGPDFLRALVESGLSEHKERRSSAIRAFLRHQFEIDEEVRFKQVELQNKLLDLFIDVPMALRDPGQGRRQLHHVYRNVYRHPSDTDAEPTLPFSDIDNRYPPGDEPNGAASLLLNPIVQQYMPHVVLEGAPGQGKSTIAQYVCQVHRMKLLQINELLDSLPIDHRISPLKLPIKIDLRDFASWLNRKNPFVSDEEVSQPLHWHKSLESFIAALISHQSGGTQFSTDDLLALARISALLLVFDGLDEVADIETRQEVVDEVVRGTQRLQENAASLQTLVTSRPAAFANSPGMPKGKYPRFELLDLKQALIMNYAERWLRARRLDSKLAAEFRRVLKAKLDQPHLRDLARNPMQLAILLSLILTRGSSLPDKRTALYDYYIDLFFNRESEKSPVVREHRDLLIDVHRYLAWVMHSEAEKGAIRASIPHERLQHLVSEYLEREGHDPALAQELFTGMVERVVALVSRIQGTFEFEVQPLREYFAACFLFYTAPQSSPGKERPGARPDRFDAIARNFYWLNVTRFYAGCYSKGELPSLVERLQDLAGQPGFHNISHPRMLAITLLSDWVFTQNPRSVQQLIQMIADGMGLRYILALAPSARHRQDSLAVLPPKCGRDELVRRCFEMLTPDLPSDFALGLISIIKMNITSPLDLASQWKMRLTGHTGVTWLKWFRYGLELGVVPNLPFDELQGLLPEGARPDVLEILYRGRRLDVLERDETTFNATCEAILDRKITLQPQRRIESPLDSICHAVDPARYALAFRDRQPVPLTVMLERRNRPQQLSSSVQNSTEAYQNHSRCMQLARVADEEVKRNAGEWATEIGPWNNIVEVARDLFGERWAFYYLASSAAGIKSNTEKCNDAAELHDVTLPLCRRARYARLRSGSAKRWHQQFVATNSSLESMFTLLVILTWATPETVIANLEDVDAALSSLQREQWHVIFYAVRRTAILMSSSRTANTWKLNVKQLPRQLSLRAACSLGCRAMPPTADAIYRKYLTELLRDDSIVLEFAQRDALDLDNFGKQDWRPNLPLIRQCYELGQAFEPFMSHRSVYADDADGMPLAIAAQITEDPTRYPGYLVNLAEERCKLATAANIVPVADIAKRDRWFATT